jgi:hypothetical protein
VARQQGKSDLRKQAEANKAELARLMKQHEIDIEHLREKHKMELEIKALEHEQKLQLLKAESELKSNEQEQQGQNALVSGLMGGLLPRLLEAPEFKKKISEALSQSM